MKFVLCGSARFETLFRLWDEQLTLIGHTVYNLAVYPRDKGGRKDWYDDDTKVKLDLIHLNKILQSDAILVLNDGGYIGDSTKREVLWARMQGRTVYWLEPRKDGWCTSDGVSQDIPNAFYEPF